MNFETPDRLTNVERSFLYLNDKLSEFEFQRTVIIAHRIKWNYGFRFSKELFEGETNLYIKTLNELCQLNIFVTFFHALDILFAFFLTIYVCFSGELH